MCPKIVQTREKLPTVRLNNFEKRSVTFDMYATLVAILFFDDSIINLAIIC